MAKKQERERVACRRENPASKSSRVGEVEGGPEASGVSENPGKISMEWEGGQVAERHRHP